VEKVYPELSEGKTGIIGSGDWSRRGSSYEAGYQICIIRFIRYYQARTSFGGVGLFGVMPINL
jgi:hypothetical protein